MDERFDVADVRRRSKEAAKQRIVKEAAEAAERRVRYAAELETLVATSIDQAAALGCTSCDVDIEDKYRPHVEGLLPLLEGFTVDNLATTLCISWEDSDDPSNT